MTPSRFEALLAPLAPFPPNHQVVAAVSGGPDSMALAWLLRRWGDPLAIIVDHGLRPTSAAEAALTATRLQALGIPSRIIPLDLPRGPAQAARAREARYQALLQACRDSARPDLFVAHHRRDQDETHLIRRMSGSGPDGLAAMPAIAWRSDARILRPLLQVDPACLRALLRHHRIPWVEDPGNTDPATTRGALRLNPAPSQTATTAQAARTRNQAESDLADELAQNVTINPTGHALVDGRMSPRAWSALVWTLSGRQHPPSPAAIARLAQAGQGTLHGVQRHGPLLVREPAAISPPIPATHGARWDGRFHLSLGQAPPPGTPPPGTIGALGADAARLRHRSTLPSLVLRTLPTLRFGTELLICPHLAYPDAATCRSVTIEFRPTRPLMGAPFAPA